MWPLCNKEEDRCQLMRDLEDLRICGEGTPRHKAQRFVSDRDHPALPPRASPKRLGLDSQRYFYSAVSFLSACWRISAIRASAGALAGTRASSG